MIKIGSFNFCQKCRKQKTATAIVRFKIVKPNGFITETVGQEQQRLSCGHWISLKQRTAEARNGIGV